MITKQQKREAFNNADRTEVKAIMDYIMIHYQDIVSIIENVSGKTYVRNNVYGDVIEREIQKKQSSKGTIQSVTMRGDSIRNLSRNNT